MIDDMTARRFGEHTQRDYVRAVKTFADCLGCSPAKASAEDLRRYQLHLAKQQTSPATINQACSALRFFFKITLDRPYLTRHLTPVQRPRKMPTVLSWPPAGPTHLRPVGRRDAGGQHRARPAIAHCGAGRSPMSARRGRQSGRRRFVRPALPVLRRPDDHRRDVRRRSARTIASAEPDQDRHLMIDVALSSASQPVSSRLQPRLGAGSRRLHTVARPSPTAAPAAAARAILDQKARRLHSRRQLSPPPAPHVPRALRPSA